MTKKIFFILWIIFFIGICENSWACRFWAAIGKEIPAPIIEQQLLTDEYSLKSLGRINRNGWSVGYYEGTNAVVYRGKESADKDPAFNKAVKIVSELRPSLVGSHIRQAASGCRDVPNPHPFIRENNGKTWMFGHNGVITKNILIDLIGEEYLKLNPPSVCADNPPSSWVDTELYFIYLLKNIEEQQGDVIKGLKKGLIALQEKIGGAGGSLNFFLSDGETLWAFRKNNSLSYFYDSDLGVSIVSSQPPNTKGLWQDFGEGSLGIFYPKAKPKFEIIQE